MLELMRHIHRSRQAHNPPSIDQNHELSSVPRSSRIFQSIIKRWGPTHRRAGDEEELAVLNDGEREREEEEYELTVTQNVDQR
jgi:hypothetical protein